MSTRDPLLPPNRFGGVNPFDPQAFRGSQYDSMDGENERQSLEISVADQGLDVTTTPINPFDFLPEYRRRNQAPSVAGAFMGGVGSGFLHPIRALTGRETEVEPIDGWTTGHTIAQFAGEMAGIGVAFFPFLKATQLGLKAVGLGARTATGAFVRTPGFALAEGAISGGLFELGSDTTEDVMTRVALGAGMGVAAEGLLLGAGAAWRRAWRTTGAPEAPATGTALVHIPRGFQSSVRQIDTDINPVALAMERNLHPAGAASFEEAVDRLKAIGNHQEQLAHAAARTVLHYQPFGFGILTGITNPGQTIRALRKQVGWDDVEIILRAADPESPAGIARVAGQAWEETADGKPMYEILMYDKRGRERIMLAGRTEQEIQEVFMGTAGPRKKFEEILDIIRTPGKEPDVPVTVLPDVDAVTAEKARRFPGEPGRLAGFADYTRGDIVVGRNVFDAVSTLVHEYTHQFTAHTAQRLHGPDVVITESALGRLNVLFDGDVTDFFKRNPVLFKRFGEDYAKISRVLQNELEEATFQTLINNQFSDTRAGAKAIADANQSYYYADSEMIPRLVELMFTDPAKARQIAPLATEAMAQQILKYSPRMKMMLSRQELKNIHQIMEHFWTKDLEGNVRVFERLHEGGQLTRSQIKQFESRGFFRGMNVRYQGEEWSIRSWTQADDGRVRIFNPMTRQTKEVGVHEIHRPLMQNLAERTDEVLRRVDEITSKPANWLGVVIRQAPELDEAATAAHPKGRKIERWAVRRAIVNLENMDRAETIAQYFAQNRELHERVLRTIREDAGGLAGKIVKDEHAEAWARLSPQDRASALQAPGFVDETFRDLTGSDVMREMTKLKGVDGVVINDQGRYLIFVGNPENALKMADETISHRWVNSVDGSHDSPWIVPSQDNVIESLLREAGVGDRELDYYRSINPFTRQARQVAEEEGLLERIMQGVQEATEKAEAEAIEITASRGGFRVDRTTDGEYRILTETNEVAAVAASEDAARAYLNAAGPEVNMPKLDGELPIQPDALPGTAGQVAPRKPFEQWPQDRPQGGFAQRFVDATQLFLATFTAMENIAKSAERRGFGPLFTKVFHPVQEALERVDNQLAGIKRDALNGRTFSEQLKLVEQLTEGPLLSRNHKKRQELYIRAIEIMSKEEIARPGGLLVRGLSDDEIKLAQTFESLGLQHDIPRLTGTLRMAKIAVNNKAQLPRKLADMRRVQVNDEFREVLDRLTQMLDDMPDTVDGVLRQLNLSEKEMLAVGMIDEILSSGADQQSLFAISRYATAKPLSKGFSSARDEFMALNNFSAKERKAVEEMERLYKAAFEVSKLDYKKEIGGYWPHMRKWIENGISPEEDFIRKHIPESVEWSAERIRTGELDVYLTDPALVSAKYVRSMLMKQEFDPILPGVKQELDNLAARDQRLHGIFAEYVHEATGRPHASFRKLHDVIATSSRILLGREPDPRFTRDLINNIGGLANAAAIPFRPMLIARNYFQMTQMIPPRTGINEFFDGLRQAMTDEGFKEAVEKNIVTKNVLPVHAATELYGHDVSGLNRRLQRIFQKGFEWYQKPDDIGRAAAFFAAKARIGRHMDDVMTGRITYEQFKQRAKINTYDSIDIQKFDELWQAGRYTEASDYIGGRLARETIFRYGHANHPAGWGSVAGRLFGTFGTWPTQYKDYLLQGLSRGSTKDRLEFLAIHSAVNAATLAAGAAAGIELSSWVAFPSLNYTGGPVADLAINVIQAFGGSPTEKALAQRNIFGMFPSLDDPRSIFIPGSYFIGDLYEAATAADAGEAIMSGLGIREISKYSNNPFKGIWD